MYTADSFPFACLFVLCCVSVVCNVLVITWLFITLLIYWALNDGSSSVAAAWILLVALNTLSSHRCLSGITSISFPVIPFLVLLLLGSCLVGSTHPCIFFWWNAPSCSGVYPSWPPESQSEPNLKSNHRLPLKRLYNIYPPNEVCHVAQSPDRWLGFLSSSRSFGSHCNHPQTFKLYILPSLCLNAWNKPQSPLLLSQVLLKTR